MRKAIAILLVGLLIGAPTVVLAAKVTAVPAAVAKAYNIDTKWYKKYTTVKGIPIIASRKVNSRALTKAAAVTKKMVLGKGYGPKIVKYLKVYRNKVGIVGRTERIRQMPEGRRLPKRYDKQSGVAASGKWVWNEKTREWKEYERIALQKEMNVLKKRWPLDKNAGNSVLMHEFAHVIHLAVLRQEFKGIDKKITQAYKAAKKKGKWKGAYAMTDEMEYFSEGTEVWFNVLARDGKGYWTNGGPYAHNRKELKKFDPTLYKILLKVYGNGKWRFRYGPICNEGYNCNNIYKLSTPFGPSLVNAAAQNMFMVGEDFDLKIHPSAVGFSFQDYEYIGVDDPAKNAFKLGVKGGTQGDTPNMGGNFALTHQGEKATYKIATDETFLGSTGGGWLSYDNAQSLYLNVGRNFDLGNNWTAKGDLTYGVSQAKAKKDSVFQDYSTIHAIGFDVAASYGWTDKDSIQFSASSPLRVEQGSLVIESPYDRERVQLSPNARQMDLGVAYTRKFKAAALTTTLQFTEDSGHYQGQDTTRIMAEYSLSF
jgi:hypothetical protein